MKQETIGLQWLQLELTTDAEYVTSSVVVNMCL